MGIPNISLQVVSERFWYAFSSLKISATTIIDPDSSVTLEEIITNSQFPHVDPSILSDGSLSFTYTPVSDVTGFIVWYSESGYSLTKTIDTSSPTEGDRFVFSVDTDVFDADTLYEVKGGQFVDVLTETSVTGATGSHVALNANKTPIYIESLEVSGGNEVELKITPTQLNADPQEGSFEWG